MNKLHIIHNNYTNLTGGKTQLYYYLIKCGLRVIYLNSIFTSINAFDGIINL